jgi:predicted nicotinamide N-methyase
MQTQLWDTVHIKDESYVLINLDHPYVEVRVRSDMDAGVAVFYDRRWGITEVLNRWLLENLDLIRGKRVLVLGAGIGAETVLLGKYCSHVWINDLAPAAVELCAKQMNQNGLKNYTTLLGSYEAIDLPEVDLVVASFLIYDPKTLRAMQTFLRNYQSDVLLVNERMKAFRQFLRSEKHTLVFDQEDGAVGIYLNRGD